MDLPVCQATKADGCVCMAIIGQTAIRCGKHANVLNRKGVRLFVYDEVEHRKRRMIRDWRNLVVGDIIEIRNVYQRILDWYAHAKLVFQRMTNEEITNLLNQRGRWYIRGHPEPILEDGFLAPPFLEPVPELPVTELGRFAADKQNIHTTRVVEITKQLCNRVLEISVPDEYRWNADTCSKTPIEIITECKLSNRATAQLMTRYLQDDNIYELGFGIYGRVLDGVWQYIRSSPNKEDLCKILKQELQDNVGMCLQGNLTRICNCLSGYLEGIASQESIPDILGREFPKLLSIQNVEDRIQKGKDILKEVGLPTSDWDDWLDALKT